ncbi:MAG: hypothetical protein KDD45_15365, partial [Bdellovibrionales bacterium]|nr:hypothetical protein [Bdellovibrionales bacterium]
MRYFLFLLIFQGAVCFAQSEELWKTKEILVSEAQKLADIYQPGAKVIVHPDFKKKEQKFPNIPFVVTQNLTGAPEVV